MLAAVADTPILVVVGAATRDVDVSDPRGWRLGGTVTYAALAAARLGVHVRALIAVDELAADAHELLLMRDAGVDVQLVRLEHGPVFDNRQTANGREQVAVQPSDVLPADALPAEWRAPSAAILGPVAGELADDWADVFGAEPFVALAWQGLLRGMTAGALVERLPMARTPLTDRADVLLVSAEDVTGTSPLYELLRAGQKLIVTHGERGALHLTLNGAGRVRARYVPPLRRRDAVDATGAGDVFLGAWIGARLLLPGVAAWKPLLVASAMAGLSVERRGLGNMPTRSEVCSELVTLRGRGRG